MRLTLGKPPAVLPPRTEIVNGNNLTGVGVCPSTLSCGLTIATENPGIVQGDFDANSGGNGWSDPEVPAIRGRRCLRHSSPDSWNDINSFSSPYSTGARNGNTSWYRMAVIGGISLRSRNPLAKLRDFGTDGGVHNFLRYIESWAGTLGISGLDRRLVLQPAGQQHLQVLHDGVQPTKPRIQL